jgi:hypothetical protein
VNGFFDIPRYVHNLLTISEETKEESYLIRRNTYVICLDKCLFLLQGKSVDNHNIVV